MGIAGLALDAVGHVEHEPRALALYDARHELFEPIDEILVTFKRNHAVAAGLERRRETLDCLEPDLLPIGCAKQIDDVATVSVVYDSDLHGMSFR